MTATAAESDRRRAEVLAKARPQVIRAADIVRGRVADAASHAARSITGAMVEKPDGAPTLDHSRRSDALKDALTRLDSLELELARHLRDSWEIALREAWAYARSEAHPEDLNGKRWPGDDDREMARRTVLEGYDARGLVAGPIAAASRSLAALVPRAASPTLTARSREDLIRTWASKHRQSIAAAASLAVVTGAYRMDALAARLVLRPELLHDDPTIPR